VDDEPEIRSLFEMILKEDLPGCRVDMAKDGAEAVDRFKKEHHSVLLMDLHMPVLDGQGAFTAIEKACRDGNWQMPSVVFCTGFAPPDTVQQIVSSDSPHCLLSKPVSAECLVDAVRCRLPR
jgi:CheY-like chemotaxis protein